MNISFSRFARRSSTMKKMIRQPRLGCEALEDRITPAVVEPGFTDTAFVSDTGLQTMTGLAWAPDGSNRLYVGRKSGQVRVINNGVLQAQNFSADTVITTSECGLIGMAFDRNYATNGYLYLFITVSTSEQQIVRYTDTINDNGTPGNLADDFRQGTNRTVIKNALPTVGANHDGGAVGIGFDNKLYWAIGDQGSGIGVDANLTTLAAKVGRSNLDGTVPSDNPFNDGAGPNNDYIWARGFRNPFTFHFQESTGQLWVNNVGTSYEQILKVNRGDHAGWNDWEGNQPAGFIQPEIIYRTNSSDTRLIPSTAVAISRTGNIVTVNYNPVAANIAFLQPGNRVTISGVSDASFNGTFDILAVNSPTQFTYAQTGANASSANGSVVTAAWGGAVTGGVFLNTTAVPAQYRGNFLFGDINTDDVMRATLDGASNITSIRQFDNGFLGIVDIAVGPDGAIYYVTAEGNSVRRTAYTQTVQNLIVTPQYQAFPEGGRTGFSVRLATAPVSDVTVNVARTSGDTDLGIFSGLTLTFTPSNWSTPQPVVVAAMADADAVNDLATFSISSPTLTTQTLNYIAIDAGGQGITVNTNNVNPTEGSNTTFTVRLDGPPAGTAVVNIARTSGDTDVTVSPATLNFDASNFHIPQTVTVFAAQDVDNVADAAVITVSTAGAIPVTVNVAVTEDDPSAPVITTTPVTTAVINAPYSYDVNASGLPAPTYALSVFPPGMTIDSSTGVISWTPAATGTVNVTVQATNGVSPPATQPFSITVNPDQAPTAVITAPTNGSTIFGTNSEFYGDGVDDVGTVYAEFRIDGTLVYTDTTPGGHYHIGGTHNLFDTTQLTNGPHTLRMTVYDTIGQSGFAEVTVTVDNPPGVLNVRANGTVDPLAANSVRSRLTSVAVNFNRPVDVSPGAFSFSGVGLGGAPVSVPTANILVAGSGTSTITLTFTGSTGVNFGSLADGRWTLNVENTLITAVGGGPVMLTDYASPQLKRLFGDVDGNGTVDAADFSFFPAFGAALNSPFDFNANNDIDSGTDLTEFGNRFGLTL